MKIGDKVRFLSETGGGIVKGFDKGNIVLVEDQDGFDIPMPINECVVIDTDDYNIAKVDIDKYGMEMLKASSSIEGKSVEELIKTDFKTYNVGNNILGISQVMTMDFNDIEKNMDEYIAKLDELSKSFICCALFITDVYRNGSYVLYNESSKDIVAACYKLNNISEGEYLDGMVSRKKQMLPMLLEYLER